MKVCYFGGFDPTYTRNYFNRLALAAADVEVVLAQVPPEVSTLNKLPALLKQYWKIGRKADVLLVAEYNPTLVPVAWLLAKLFRQTLVFDLVISLYLGTVVERQRHDPKSWAARKLWWIEKVAGALSDGMLTGSNAYRTMLAETFGFPETKLQVIPLGVDAEQFSVATNQSPNDPPQLLYFGSFIPNHGVDVIVDALAQVQQPFQMTFLGDGERKAEIQKQIEALGIQAEFLPRVPFAEVPTYVAQADILFGVFGDTPQADTAMANKVLQSLAMYKPVVTGATASNREHFVAGEHLLEVPLGDANALAMAIGTLLGDRDLRQRLAQTGGEHLQATLTPVPVGKRLKAALEAIR